jgi:hypothetical protein
VSCRVGLEDGPDTRAFLFPQDQLCVGSLCVHHKCSRTNSDVVYSEKGEKLVDVYTTQMGHVLHFTLCVYWREENGEAFTGKRRRVDRGCSWAVHLNPSIHYKRTFGPCWDVPVLLGK